MSTRGWECQFPETARIEDSRVASARHIVGTMSTSWGFAIVGGRAEQSDITEFRSAIDTTPNPDRIDDGRPCWSDSGIPDPGSSGHAGSSIVSGSDHPRWGDRERAKVRSELLTANIKVYLVLEFVDYDLAKITRALKHPGLGLADAKNIARQMLDGLTYLHSKQILHRDLKLSNLLLSQIGVGAIVQGRAPAPQK